MRANAVTWAAVIAVMGTAMLGTAAVSNATADQALSRPADPPTISARGQTWYEQRVPLEFNGDVYLRAGPVVFFNGNSMVRTGYFHGIPLYVNATLEPHSVVFVPIGGGLLQPYERPRTGSLAGTTGSRAPSFPVDILPGDDDAVAEAATSPTSLPRSGNTEDALIQESMTRSRGRFGQPDEYGAVGTVGLLQPEARAVAVTPAMPVHLETVIPPYNNDGLWVEFAGMKWIQSGRAVMLRTSEFVRAGDYAGFPVFARRQPRSQAREVIYLPTTSGMVAPYRLSD